MIIQTHKKQSNKQKNITPLSSRKQSLSYSNQNPKQETLTHTHLEQQISSRHQEELTAMSCQNHFLRQTILILYRFFEQRGLSWDLNCLSYRQMTIILKELRYVKSEEGGTLGEQSEETKKCYYLWVNISRTRLVTLGNVLRVICRVQGLQIEDDVIEEVIIELQKGIDRFERECFERGDPCFIFLCKREGMSFKDGVLVMEDSHIRSLRKELSCFRYTRLMEGNPKVDIEEGEEEAQIQFMSKKSVELAEQRRQKMQEEIQRKGEVETVELYHILNYKEDRVKFAESKFQEVIIEERENRPKMKDKKVKSKISSHQPAKGFKKDKENRLDNKSKKNELKTNRNDAKPMKTDSKIRPRSKASRRDKTKPCEEMTDLLAEELGLSDIVKTQIIQEIDSFDDHEDNLASNTELLNNEVCSLLPQSMIVPESAPKKRREYIDIPILFVDVNIEQGRKERIVVYDGDTAQELALQFGRKHGLGSETVCKLQQMLRVQIGSVLTKIDEATEQDCSYLY